MSIQNRSSFLGGKVTPVITYENIIETLSIIWSADITSIPYIKSTEWIDSNKNQIQKALDLKELNLNKNSPLKVILTLSQLRHIIADINLLKNIPKWKVILESLFKMGLLNHKTIEPAVLKEHSKMDLNFRKMMIYFFVLSDSLGLTSNPYQSSKWSINDFVQRASWIRKHTEEIMKIFNLRKSSQRGRKSNLDQTMFLTNKIFLRFTGTKIERHPSKFEIRKTGDDTSLI